MKTGYSKSRNQLLKKRRQINREIEMHTGRLTFNKKYKPKSPISTLASTIEFVKLVGQLELIEWALKEEKK